MELSFAICRITIKIRDINMLKKKLKDCCIIIAGQSPNSKYYNTDGIGIPFFQGKADFGEIYPKVRVYCSEPTKIAEKDDILLSVRAPVGPTNLSPGTVCIGRGLTAIRPTEILNLKYLLYFFRYFEVQLQRQGTGTTFKAITQDIVKNLEVPIPSMIEQKRIVARIEELFSELDKAVETLKTTKEQLAVYRQAVISDAYPEMTDDNTMRLDEIAEITGGVTKGRKLVGQETEFLPYLRVANVQNGFLDLSVIKTIELKKSEIDKYLLKSGDVLYTEGGDRDKLGRGTVWNNEVENCVHQNHVFKARLNLQYAIPQYVAYWSMSGFARNYFYNKGKQSVNLASINKTVLSALTIPILKVDSQKIIVAEIESRLSVCDSIEQTVDTALQQSEAMRQSILKQAFEGRL
jgi:type I restriction enzyme S subunit